MEISFVDLLVAEFRPNPIATAASPAVTHMTARRIEVSCPCKSKLEYRTLERGIGGRSVSYFTLRISIILMETMKDLYINLAAGVLGERWPSRLVVAAAENSQRWAFEAVATWLSANAPGDTTSATHQSLRL